MLRELETKQLANHQSREPKSEATEEIPKERLVVDPEIMKSERRKKAALFLDQMKRDRASGIIHHKSSID